MTTADAHKALRQVHQAMAEMRKAEKMLLAILGRETERAGGVKLINPKGEKTDADRRRNLIR